MNPIRSLKTFLLWPVLTVAVATAQTAPQPELPHVPEGATTCIVANDLGRNGYYEQKSIAELMGSLAEQTDIEFVVAPGDVHHFEGVRSTTDPLWLTNYELIYSHPDLMIPWYPVLGNHEYRGNTQAVIDYSQVSARWRMPARYYARTVEAGDAEALLLFIDTAPLITRYAENSEKYPDADRQDTQAQLRWIEQQLSSHPEARWKIVFGHHPLYADTDKKESERTDLQRQLEPLFNKYGVDFYICGHIHNFQHVQPKGSKVDYLVNSSGSLARSVKPVAGTRFCSDEAGFTVLSMAQDTVSVSLMNGKGKIIYHYDRTQKPAKTKK